MLSLIFLLEFGAISLLLQTAGTSFYCCEMLVGIRWTCSHFRQNYMFFKRRNNGHYTFYFHVKRPSPICLVESCDLDDFAAYL